MYGGINLYPFTGGPCAELVALGHAGASGAREIAAIRSVRITDLMPLGAVWTPGEGTQDFSPALFDDSADG